MFLLWCKDIPILLVGNKCDLEDERKVPIEKGKEKAKNLNCAFFETSALKKINIDVDTIIPVQCILLLVLL